MRRSESMQKPGMHSPLRVCATCGRSPSVEVSRLLKALRFWLRMLQQPEIASTHG